MRALAELIESPTLSPLLGYVSRPPEEGRVDGVAVIEDLGHLERARPHSILLLTRALSAQVSTSRFDAALDLAVDRGVPALVLHGADVSSVASSTIAIAQRSGTAILGAMRNPASAELALAIGRELAGDADAALLRAYETVRAVETHPAGATLLSLLERAGAALGVPISMTSQEQPMLSGRPVVIDGRIEGWISAPAEEGDSALALEIALNAVAAGAADALVEARRPPELPVQSRQEALTDLLAAAPEARQQLATRARAVGFDVEGWHVVVSLDFERIAIRRRARRSPRSRCAPASPPMRCSPPRRKVASGMTRVREMPSCW